MKSIFLSKSQEAAVGEKTAVSILNNFRKGSYVYIRYAVDVKISGKETKPDSLSCVSSLLNSFSALLSYACQAAFGL